MHPDVPSTITVEPNAVRAGIPVTICLVTSCFSNVKCNAEIPVDLHEGEEEFNGLVRHTLHK